MSPIGPRIVVGAEKRAPAWGWLAGGVAAGVLVGLLVAPVREAVLPGEALQRTAALEAERDELKQALAVAQRGEQVTRTSLEALRDEVAELQGEVASLSEELSFYESMVAGGGNGRGLAVHSLELRPTPAARVYEFRLVLGQRLRRAQPISGELRWTLSGLQGDQLVRLDGETLKLDTAKDFEFKYFQEMRGELQLPEGFQPQFLEIAAQASNGASATARVAWAEALNT